MNVILPYALTETKIANFLAKIAVRALYFELRAYPKPGLVSFVDSGAHQDMNGETLYRSLFSLRHYFQQIARQGLSERNFDSLKQTAIKAEQRMLEKTRGVNTHRGAIFALGLVCISAARLIEKTRFFSAAKLHEQLLRDWQLALAEHQPSPHSHGALVRNQFKVMDAKQMAAQGYELPFHILESFISLFLQTKSINTICLFAYLELLIRVDDTNILYRKGLEGLAYAKKSAAKILAVPCPESQFQQALSLHHLFSQQGISPGGVADLLALMLFLGQLFCEPLQCHY